MKTSTYNQFSAAIVGIFLGVLLVLVSFVAVSCTERPPTERLSSPEMFDAIKTCNRRGLSVRFRYDVDGAPTSWWCVPNQVREG